MTKSIFVYISHFYSGPIALLFFKLTQNFLSWIFNSNFFIWYFIILFFYYLIADLGPKVLKERFSAFSKEFDEITKNHRTFSVPDAWLREELRKELYNSVIPTYTIFYNKYRKTSFTKNPAKYIKYTPEQVSSAIRTFFDGVS